MTLTEPAHPAASFRVRPAEPGDADRIAALFEAAFQHARTTEEVRWKLFDTSARASVPTSYVAEADGRMVGHYGGTPIRFLIDGRERVGLHGCDVMTAPEWRRRGVLTALGTAAHEAWRGSELALVTGLANEAWGSRAAALGWVEMFPIRWLRTPIRPEAILARRLGLAVLGRLTALGTLRDALVSLRAGRDPTVRVEHLDPGGAECDALWREVRDRLGYSVVRDAAWVRWRYLACPAGSFEVLLARRDGRPVGYLAHAASGEGHGVVAELFTHPDDRGACTELLRASCEVLRARDVESAYALAVPGSVAWSVHRRAGFLATRGYQFELVRLDRDLILTDLSRPESWTLAGGDFDVL